MFDEIYALDLETAPTKPTDLPFALEPYRVLKGESQITSVAVYGDSGATQSHYRQSNFVDRLRDIVIGLEGKTVFAHNATFDVSYLIAQLGVEVVSKVNWFDTATLNKWLVNGQRAERKAVSFSLLECLKRAAKTCKEIAEHPELEEFLGIKEAKVIPGEEFDYWLRRGQLDAEMTFLLARHLLKYLKQPLQKGYIVTSRTILPISEGYIKGIDIDTAALKEYELKSLKRQKEIVAKLGIEGSTLTSTKKLCDLLFDKWDFKPVGYTPKGAPSVSHENLMKLHAENSDDRLDLIMEYKQIATMQSKYVKGFKSSIAYLGYNKIHGSPRILSTITGRMTYSSKLMKKYQISIAMHQLPRKEKAIKRAMVAPKGFKVLYMDFSAQEGRVMAIVAPEPTMIESYCKGIDLHSDLTEEIFGTPYDVIVEANNNDEPKEIVEQRQAGKLTGLSSFYRIGAPALAGKFFTTYNYSISNATAQSYLTSFKRKYPEVPEYWKRAIADAKYNGYAEAFGGWRFRIDTFDWKGESSAINHPIQGGGSMLTYAAIGEIKRMWPQTILVSQVHDSVAYFIPEEGAEKLGADIINTMSRLDYGELLGFEQTVPLIFDGGIGDNFADIKTIKRAPLETNLNK